MSSEIEQPDVKRFETGAIRSRDADGERYDLITPIGLEGVARIYAEGAKKYGEALWEKGFPISDLVNHALRHWRLFASGDRSEDHLSKAAWGFLAARHSEVMWPHLNTNMRRMVGDQPCVASVVDDETAASWKRFGEQMDGLREEYREADGKAEIREGDIVFHPRTHVPTKYHFIAHSSHEPTMLAYRSDLQHEGHEVVTRWLDEPHNRHQSVRDAQSSDVIIIFVGDKEHWTTEVVSYARSFGKPVVVIGSPPADFPQHGTTDRWFLNWPLFLEHLSSSRTGVRHASSAR